jgi:hypothetical protein
MDWFDITLHVLGALLICTIVLVFGLPREYMAINVVWFLREAWQHRHSLSDLILRKQCVGEWSIPTVLTVVIYSEMR